MRQKGKGAYVYAIVVDDVVRYIGKGRTYRVGQHMTMVRSIARRRAAGEFVSTTYFYNRLTKAWLAGAEIETIVIAEGMTDEDAFAREVAEIAAALQGQLWNVWPGGEGGGKGHVKTLEQRRRIAESNRKTWSDPQLLAEHSARCKVVLLRPEVKALISKPKSPEHNQKVSERARARWATPEFKAKMDAVFHTPEFHERRSEATKRGWATRRARQK